MNDKCGYIDDFLFVASSEEEAWRMLRQALSDIEELGLAPSYRKTIVPTKRLKFLGVLVDSETSAPGSSGLARASQASYDRGTRWPANARGATTSATHHRKQRRQRRACHHELRYTRTAPQSQNPAKWRSIEGAQAGTRRGGKESRPRRLGLQGRVDIHHVIPREFKAHVVIRRERYDVENAYNLVRSWVFSRGTQG